MISKTPLTLSQVTLCAATSVNVDATINAIKRCLDLATFGEVILFTDKILYTDTSAIKIVRINNIYSSEHYSKFILKELPGHINTDYVIICQWDGFIIDSDQWSNDFLEYDYIGAVWPQFSDGPHVGNGGFSLRSKRLLNACQDPSFIPRHPEDICICRDQRAFLEERHGIRFAPPAIAARFSWERTKSHASPFGFHGVFNLMEAVGPRDFADVYLTLDNRSTTIVDFWKLARQCLRERRVIGALKTAQILWRLSQDWIGSFFARLKSHRRNAACRSP